MKIAIIAFSKCGAVLGARISKGLKHQAKCYITRRHASGTDFEPFDSIYELTALLFRDRNALIFIGSVGIAVRAIAPLIKSKLSDPAIVVCDETGRFAVSVLSGHTGGANKLATEIAGILDATPVITTASDCHTILNDVEQPKNLVLGIGCRRGLSAETIERAATILLWDHNIPLARVTEVATIDIKQDESGLLGFAAAHKLPLRFFTASELNGVTGEFTSSEQVLQWVGVDNVCERAAILCGGKGKLIMKKAARDGVTVAVFEKG